MIDLMGLYRGYIGIMEKKRETTILGLGFRGKHRPRVDTPPPLNGYHNRDPTIKALKGRGCMNQGSTLGFRA